MAQSADVSSLQLRVCLHYVMFFPLFFFHFSFHPLIRKWKAYILDMNMLQKHVNFFFCCRVCFPSVFGWYFRRQSRKHPWRDRCLAILRHIPISRSRINIRWLAMQQPSLLYVHAISLRHFKLPRTLDTHRHILYAYFVRSLCIGTYIIKVCPDRF